VVADTGAGGMPGILVYILAEVISQYLQEVLLRTGKECLPDA
jgi:hypothetical protein